MVEIPCKFRVVALAARASCRLRTGAAESSELQRALVRDLEHQQTAL
jgi:hypothetical protein